jgi:glucose/arabinose dehydrogenase
MSMLSSIRPGAAPRIRFSFMAVLRALAAASACAFALAPPVHAQPVKTLAQGLVNPWSLAFLPDGRMLVTERPGNLRIVTPDGKVGPPLAGVPRVYASGQGGLLDVSLDPEFARNRLVYLSYAEPGEGGAGTAVARGRLDGEASRERLGDARVIFRQKDKVGGGGHFGSRLVWDRAGRLFVTLGDRYTRKDDAQNLATHFGKIVRIEADGKVPHDNPFAKDPRALTEIWSYGHRNVQGAALHPQTGELWASEHGPQGGDEVNRVQRGANHGWPVITYGRNYVVGTVIGEGTERAGVVAPLRHWVPRSIAPSGMAFVTGDRYPTWQGHLLIGALAGRRLVLLKLDGAKVVDEVALLVDLGARIRDVRQGPDGYVYVLTDDTNGKLLRIESEK